MAEEKRRECRKRTQMRERRKCCKVGQNGRRKRAESQLNKQVTELQRWQNAVLPERRITGQKGEMRNGKIENATTQSADRHPGAR
jgi:hypothetical protein